MGNSKLRTYKTFKVNLNLESVRAHRMVLTKFTTSAHQLRIETGRYQRLEDKEKISLLFDLDEIKSELHFLMDCSPFKATVFGQLIFGHLNWPVILCK